MALSERDNYIRTVRRNGPEWMPCRVVVSTASWNQLRGEAEEVLLRHPVLFPGFRKGQKDLDSLPVAEHQRRGRKTRDAMGCIWETDLDGITGVVTGHPLDDWSKVRDWQPPPVTAGRHGPFDWERIGATLQKRGERGELRSGGLAHGFLFLRLTDLCGFENVMLAMADNRPELRELIRKLDARNQAILERYIELGVDVVHLPEDLGAQTSSVISPEMFRTWCFPSYRMLIERCKRAGALVHVHSDGHTLELMDIFEALGVDIVNPQDLVNGIDNIARECKGRFCIDLDVDRQSVVPFGKPKDIRALIEQEVRTLGSPDGGLMLVCGIYPPTPPENLNALCSAMEEFRTHWFR